MTQAYHVLPANPKATPPKNRLLEESASLAAGAQSYAQFIDRDTADAVSSVAMTGFQEFLVHPDRLDRILETIDRAAKRAYPN